jgi:hypothetical protein
MSTEASVRGLRSETLKVAVRTNLPNAPHPLPPKHVPVDNIEGDVEGPPREVSLDL